MKQVMRLKSKMNFYGSLLLSTLLPSLIATSLLAIVLLPLMSHTVKSTDQAYQQTILYAGNAEFEALANGIADMVASVEHSNWIHGLYLDMLNDKYPDAALQKDIIYNLNQACIRRNAKSYSFRFYDDPVLYNNRCVISNLAYYQKNYPTQIAYRFFPCEGQLPAFSSQMLDGVEYLLYKTPFRDIDGGRYKGEINILFQSSQIGEKLSEAAGPDATAFRITDQKGNIFWEYHTGLDNEEVVTLSQTSSFGSFCFCVDIPRRVSNHTEQVVLPVIVGVLLFSLVCSAILSYYLSQLTYRPLRQILYKFVGDDHETNNEISALEQVFDGVLQEKSEMQTMLDRLRPIVRQKVLSSLLNGTAFLSDETRKQLEFCRIQFEYKRYNVIAIEAPFSQTESEDGKITAELVMETMLEHLFDNLPMHSWLYCEDCDHYRVLANYESWDTLHSYVSLLENKLHQYFDLISIEKCFFVGIGSVVFSIEELYRADEKASTALKIAALNHIIQPLFYSEVEEDLNSDYFYPLSEELLLSRAITNCNIENAKSLLYAIIDENRRRSFQNPNNLWRLFMDLSSTIVRSANAIGIHLPPADLKERVISLDEINTVIGQSIDALCLRIQEKRQSSISSNEQEILDYIDNHLYDSELSLANIADRFSRSTAYVSTTFKDRRGTNYYDYVNHMRIMRALQLMAEQNLSMNAVYPMVGYVSLSTFRRNFKKYAHNVSKEDEIISETDC